jgi:hypothetical protein
MIRTMSCLAVIRTMSCLAVISKQQPPLSYLRFPCLIHAMPSINAKRGGTELVGELQKRDKGQIGDAAIKKSNCKLSAAGTGTSTRQQLPLSIVDVATQCRQEAAAPTPIRG